MTAMKTARRKYRFGSREEAEAAYLAADRDRTVSTIALNAVLAGEVHWLAAGVYRVGLCRADSPSGGVVLVEFAPGGQAPHACAYYLEEWAASLRGAYALCREGADLRRLAQEALALRDRLVRGGGGPVTAPIPFLPEWPRRNGR